MESLVGYQLPNGGIIVANKPLKYKEGSHPACPIFAVLPTGMQRYVIWTYVIPPNTTGATPYCISGDYFTHFEDAVKRWLSNA